MVDNQDREAVRAHHDHVLRPRLDVFVRVPFTPQAKTLAGGTGFALK
jgi:hypothetical protein